MCMFLLHCTPTGTGVTFAVAAGRRLTSFVIQLYILGLAIWQNTSNVLKLKPRFCFKLELGHNTLKAGAASASQTPG